MKVRATGRQLHVRRQQDHRREVHLPTFKLKTGDWYSDKPIRNGLVKAREMYGSLGYFEFTGFPGPRAGRGGRGADRRTRRIRPST
jgi:hypothetical protein